jgi:chemotaxis protein methyltransferase CheR
VREDPFQHTVRLSVDDLQRLTRLINERSGLLYESNARAMLERRLVPQVRARGLSSFEEYIDLLESGSPEIQQVYELLTTKETYFFRQEYQLRAFSEELLPRIFREGGEQRRLTIWCAGCSSGEETYTVAMLVLNSGIFRDWKVRILGTDLCSSNIDFATRGIYRPTSFRSTSEEQKEKHFERVDGGFRVNRELKRLVHFSTGNIRDQLDVRSVGRVDVVFCRNVLIYFDEASRRSATDLFYERLLPGGYLLLGHSESLLNVDTEFDPVHLEGDLVYRRPPARGTRLQSRNIP